MPAVLPACRAAAWAAWAVWISKRSPSKPPIVKSAEVRRAGLQWRHGWYGLLIHTPRKFGKVQSEKFGKVRKGRGSGRALFLCPFTTGPRFRRKKLRL